MKLILKELKNGINHLSFKTEGVDLDIKPEEIDFSSEVKMKFSVLKVGNSFNCQGEIKARLKLECARCLTEYVQPVISKIEFILEMDDEKVGMDTQDDDYQFIAKETISYDLNPRVRETMILTLPIKPLCQEDCKGLCQFCGTNLNEKTCSCSKEMVDPRWNKLKELLS
ncbi:MAG: hypothetical protein RBG1_1C00001G1830 [candidate division Zixibacteria bacterium RBG-1]|nr:MAG: hypothetical protein RBG1_1C00001G1830 [candidate division Zixibacteria bacterium RBG-1]OGC85969.1 MAG: hypothetical protein A2V73_04000 [candidate division Zixibacteria bacterium RBG_19FT_COMBO_42_43]